MKWWEKPLRVLQFNLEDPYGYFADRVDEDYLVRLARKTRSNVLVVFARDAWGRVFYEGSRIYPKHHRARLDVSKLVEKASRKGIKVIVMGNHTANRYIYRLHPEYAQRNINDEVIVLEHYPVKEKVADPHWPLICPNSPAYDEYFLPEAAEIVKITKAHGYLLDSFRYLPDYPKACYCRYCRRAFKEETGLELPKDKSLDDPSYKHAWEWRYRVIKDKIIGIKQEVKKKNPDILFLYNSHPAGWAGRGNRVAEILRDHLDGVFAEATEADFKGPGLYTFISKLTRAMIGEGKPIFVSRNLFYTLRTSQSAPPTHIRMGIWEIVASGANPWATVFSSQAFNDQRAFDALAEAYRILERIEDYLKGLRPVRYAGIVFSNLTHDIYHHFHPQFYVGEVIGFSLLMMHSHLPWSIVSDTELENGKLEEYPLLVLPNTGVLSDRSTVRLEEYFWEKKGNIIATHEIGVIRPDYTYRESMSLENVFGIRYEGVLKFGYTYVSLDLGGNSSYREYWSGLTRTVPLGDPSSSFRRERVEPLLGEIVRTVPEGSKPLAWLRMGKSAYGYEYTLGKSTPAPGSPLRLPGITLRRGENNASLYYSFRLGAHYDRLGHPDYHSLLDRPLRKHAPLPPITVKAPETVQTEYYMRGKDQFVVQLVNHTYNQRMLDAPQSASRQHLAGFDPYYSVHPIKNVIPVHGIRIILTGTGYRAYDPIKQRDLRVLNEKEKSLTILSLDKLEEYSLILLEKRK